MKTYNLTLTETEMAALRDIILAAAEAEIEDPEMASSVANLLSKTRHPFDRDDEGSNNPWGKDGDEPLPVGPGLPGTEGWTV